MNRLKKILCALVVFLGSAAVMAEERIIGTIEAEIGGVPNTWYLLYGEIDATHSAVWMARAEGLNTAMIGGYESPDVAFSTGNGMPSVSGEGSALVISFTYLAAETASPELSDAIPVNVLLMEQVGDYASSRMAEDVVIEVTEIKLAADGTARMSGTFSGMLPERDSDSPSVAITNGNFQVEAARQAMPR